MKSLAMFGNKRSQTGKSATKAIRNEGKVPCVLYGGKEHLHFSIYEADFKQLVYTPQVYKVQLDIDGTVFKAILKDIQFHPVNDSIIHADFLEIHDDKPVEMMVPVAFTGNSPGVRAGGKLIVKSKKLRVWGLPTQLPDQVEVSIEKMEIGDTIKVGDLNPENITLLDSPNNPVVSVKVTRAVATAEATPAAGAAPAADKKEEKK